MSSRNLLLEGATDGMCEAVAKSLREELKHRLIKEVLDPMLDEALEGLRVRMYKAFENQSLNIIVKRFT